MICTSRVGAGTFPLVVVAGRELRFFLRSFFYRRKRVMWREMLVRLLIDAVLFFRPVGKVPEFLKQR